MNGWRAVAVKTPKEQFGRGATHGRAILGDDRDPRLEQIGQLDVIEADQRDAVVETKPPKCPVSTNRDEVLAGEDCSRRPRQGEHLGGGRLGALDALQAKPYKGFIDGDALRHQLFQVALMADRGGGDRLPVAKVSDAPVSVADEVTDSPTYTCLIVGQDRVGVEEGGRPVHEHDGGPGTPVGEQVAVVVAGRDDDESIHPTRRKRGEQLTLARSRAKFSMELWSCDENGLETSPKMTPIVALFPSARRRLLAVRL